MRFGNRAIHAKVLTDALRRAEVSSAEIAYVVTRIARSTEGYGLGHICHVTVGMNVPRSKFDLRRNDAGEGACTCMLRRLCDVVLLLVPRRKHENKHGGCGYLPSTSKCSAIFEPRLQSENV